MTSVGFPVALFLIPFSTPDCTCIIIFIAALGEILTFLKNLGLVRNDLAALSTSCLAVSMAYGASAADGA